MKNFNLKPKVAVFVLAVLIPLNPWIGLPSVVWAQDDALSPPTPAENQLKGVEHKPVAPTKTVTETEPADVVGQNGETAPEGIPSSSPTPSLRNPSFTVTPSPTPVSKPDIHSKKTSTPNRTPLPSPTPALPNITTIPNPAYGDKVIFRVMTKDPAKVHIVVYDRFFSKVKELHGEGDRLFDILWSLKKVSQGIYYYQAEITDTATGGSQMLKMQSFAVMKDEMAPENP